VSEPTLPADLPHPRTFTDGRLLEVLCVTRQQEADGSECECNTCRAAKREVLAEATRRGMTGLPT
jgi:hypothetical protein